MHTNSTIKKRIRRVTQLLGILFILVSILSYSVLSMISNNKQTINNITNQVYANWEKSTNTYLNLVKTKFELALNNNQFDINDNGSIQRWLTNNMNLMDMKNINHMDEISVLCIGYTLNTDFSNLENALKEKGIYTEDIYNNIKCELQDLVLVYREAENTQFLIDVSSSAEKVAKLNNLEYNTVKDIYVEILLNKNTVLMSSNGISIEDLLDEDSYELKELKNGNLWTETVVIPEGSLGFNNEPPYINNEENVKYKKIAITVSANSEDVLNNYNYYIKEYNKMVQTSLILLCIVILSSIILIVVSFHNMLKLNEMCGEKIYGDNNEDN